ncbi:MAG: hypothetical protein U0R24_16110 [Solirubrobacterales bacterium]
MSRLKLAGLIVAAVALIAAASAGGYLLGDGEAADQSDVISAKRAASREAFALSNLQSMSSSLERGIDQGLSDGEERADYDGNAEGTVAGQKAASKEAGGLLASRRGGGNDDLGAGSPPPLDGSGEVLVVGDSLEVLTSPYIEQYLKEQGITVTTNAVGGYNSYQIYDLFQESYGPSQSVIVFDAGTNDNPNYPEILAGNLDKVAGQIGNRCMVVPTIHGLTVDGVGNQGKNRVVAEFAASRPGTQTPDWAGAVAEHPELMQPDDLHPIAEGADYRAQLIVEGVEACLGQSGSF